MASKQSEPEFSAMLARVVENGKRSNCKSNLQQIAMGIMQYTQDYEQDYEEAFPRVRQWEKENSSLSGFPGGRDIPLFFGAKIRLRDELEIVAEKFSRCRFACRNDDALRHNLT